jgi:hypothetical protein
MAAALPAGSGGTADSSAAAAAGRHGGACAGSAAAAGGASAPGSASAPSAGAAGASSVPGPSASNMLACSEGDSSTGSWSSDSRPRSSRNWRVVAYRPGGRGFAVADDLDPAAVLELLDDGGVDGDAADVLHVAARDRLAVGDDGQRLQRGTGVPGGFSGCRRSRYSRISGRLWKRQPLATCTSSTPRWAQSSAQLQQQVLMVSAPSIVVEQHAHLAHRQGCCAQIRAVSRTRLASAVFMVWPFREGHPAPADQSGSGPGNGSCRTGEVVAAGAASHATAVRGVGRQAMSSASL